MNKQKTSREALNMCAGEWSETSSLGNSGEVGAAPDHYPHYHLRFGLGSPLGPALAHPKVCSEPGDTTPSQGHRAQVVTSGLVLSAKTRSLPLRVRSWLPAGTTPVGLLLREHSGLRGISSWPLGISKLPLLCQAPTRPRATLDEILHTLPKSHPDLVNF